MAPNSSSVARKREKGEEREKEDRRQCEQQRESCLMMKGDPLISSSRDTRQTERGEDTPLTPPPTHASSYLRSFTLSSQPISRELLINTHALSLQPVTSSARISVLKDNLTPVWVATTLWEFNIAVLMSDMTYSILTLLLGQKNVSLAQDLSSLRRSGELSFTDLLGDFNPVQTKKKKKK